MKIITLNLNGIRSATRKGVFNWLNTQNADVICVQELKAQQADILAGDFNMAGFSAHYHFAEKKGYSGVGIYTKHRVHNVVTGLGFPVADSEGRYVAVDLGECWVASLYLPSGTSGEERQAIKYQFLDIYGEQLSALTHPYIICGDWNIAHKNIDLKNWRGNQKNSGFLPEERAWMDKLFNDMKFVDAFRIVNQEADQYTWWSNRGQAWAKNVGWRIDYQIVSPQIKSLVKSAHIYKTERFSDHAPLVMEYDIAIK